MKWKICVGKFSKLIELRKLKELNNGLTYKETITHLVSHTGMCGKQAIYKFLFLYLNCKFLSCIVPTY